MKQFFLDFQVAFQFMTRLPLPTVQFHPSALARAAKFFPIVGLTIGLIASVASHLLSSHLSRPLTALLALVFFILVTGALHEDGLADAADGFGGGWDRKQVLAIMRDSRIGSYGTLALILSIAARLILLATLPLSRWMAFVVSAQVLCRWTMLPLSYWLRPARQEDGQGARVAQKVSAASLIIGTIFSIAIAWYFLRAEFWIPVLAASVVTLLSGLYYLNPA
jgi:adenosylcobinamide-GDP ribazoletransferase